MTPEDAASRFEKLRQMVAKEMPTFIEQRVAHSAAEYIRLRVTQQGKNYLGGSFKPYSKKPMLTSGTTAKGKNVWRAMGSKSTRARGLNWVTIKRGGKNIHLFELKGGYAQLRRLEGLQSSHKDFEFTLQMWRNFGVTRKTTTQNEVIVTLKGKNPEAQKKINENSKRENISIIGLSDIELKKLAKMVDKELQRYINKLGLS